MQTQPTGNIDVKARKLIKENLQHLDPAQVKALISYLMAQPNVSLRKNAPKFDDDAAAAAKLHALVGATPAAQLGQSIRAARDIIDGRVVQWIQDNKENLTPAQVTQLTTYLNDVAIPRGAPGAALAAYEDFETLQALVGNTIPTRLVKSIAAAGEIIDERVVQWIEENWSAIAPNDVSAGVLETYLRVAHPRVNAPVFAGTNLTQPKIAALHALVGTTPQAQLGKSITAADNIVNRKVARWIKTNEGTLTKVQADAVVTYLSNAHGGRQAAVAAMGAVGQSLHDIVGANIPQARLTTSLAVAQKITDNNTAKWIEDNKKRLTTDEVHQLITYLNNAGRAAIQIPNGTALHAIVDNRPVANLTESIAAAREIIDKKVVQWIRDNDLNTQDVATLITYLKDGARANAPEFSDADGATLHALVGGNFAANIPVASLTASIAAAEEAEKEGSKQNTQENEHDAVEQATRAMEEQLIQQALLQSTQEEGDRQLLKQIAERKQKPNKAGQKNHKSYGSEDLSGNEDEHDRRPNPLLSLESMIFGDIKLGKHSIGQRCVSQIQTAYEDIRKSKSGDSTDIHKTAAPRILRDAFLSLKKNMPNANISEKDVNDFVEAMQKQIKANLNCGTDKGVQGEKAGFSAWRKKIQSSGNFDESKMEKFALISAEIQRQTANMFDTAKGRSYASDSDKHEMRSYRLIQMLDKNASASTKYTDEKSVEAERRRNTHHKSSQQQNQPSQQQNQR